MPEDLKKRVEGRLSIAVGFTDVHDVIGALRPLAEETKRKIERGLLDRWSEGVATGRRAASGLSEIVAALEDKRVEAILADESVPIPDDLVEAAVRQSADVVIVRHHEDLRRVAALLTSRALAVGRSNEPCPAVFEDDLELVLNVCYLTCA